MLYIATIFECPLSISPDLYPYQLLQIKLQFKWIGLQVTRKFGNVVSYEKYTEKPVSMNLTVFDRHATNSLHVIQKYRHHRMMTLGILKVKI